MSRMVLVQGSNLIHVRTCATPMKSLCRDDDVTSECVKLGITKQAREDMKAFRNMGAYA